MLDLLERVRLLVTKQLQTLDHFVAHTIKSDMMIEDKNINSVFLHTDIPQTVLEK